MSVDDLRQQLQDIDRSLVSLLNERAEVSRRIVRTKDKTEAEGYAPEREKLVLDHLAALNKGPLSDGGLRDIYAAVLAATRAVHQPLRIAYLGPAGTFSHEAALRRFGSAVSYLPSRNIAEVFSVTEKGQADYGVVPVENSTGGPVTHTLDMFVDSELKIRAEFSLVVAQFLLANCDLGDIRRVYSHPQPIAQCREWLAAHLPDAEIVESASTSHAAQLAAGEQGAAAIATETAAQLYGLRVVAPRIEDYQNNITRFLVIGQKMGQRSGADQTSLIFSIRDRVGALHDALDAFRRFSINMTRIESRPSKRKAWDYLFFVDIIGHPDDEHVAAALAELARECVLVKVLGAWPQE